MPAIGDVLGGKYRVHAKLGEGGMGAVFRAENIVTGKQVAIKWMHPHVAARAESSARLLREAQATARIDHPNIVDVYDIVQDEQTLFMVMALLEGETLRAYFARPEPVKVSELIALLLPAIDGVAVAHENGVIHRDLKPDNIFLARSRSGAQVSAKVLDFGIAKLASHHGLTLTDTGAAMGTPLYMSLEQLRGDRDVDARADVYALGTMLYEAMAGVTPFQADTLPELVFKVTTSEPAPLKQLRPDIPTPLARLVEWAITRQREQRLPDLRTLIRELEPFARDRGFAQQMTNPDTDAPRLAVRSKVSALSPTANTLPLSAPGDEQPEHDTFKARVISTQARQRKRSPLVWIAGAAAIAVAVAVALWLREPTQPLSAALTPTVPVEQTTPAAPTQVSPIGQAPPSAAASPAALPQVSSAEQTPPSAATSSSSLPQVSPIGQAPPSAATNPASALVVAPRPVASKAPAAEAALYPGTPSEPQSRKPPPLPAPVPIKPAHSARAPQSQQPTPAEPSAQPQQPKRATQAGKTAAEVLAF